MAVENENGLGALTAVALIAFLAGRCSVDDAPAQPAASEIQQFSDNYPTSTDSVAPDTHSTSKQTELRLAGQGNASDTAAELDPPTDSQERLTTTVGDTPEPEKTEPVYIAPAPPKAAKADTSVYYRNCSHARAMGAAPVRAGDPGYSRKLDRDGDGVGCE